jgi:hypothetical protein
MTQSSEQRSARSARHDHGYGETFELEVAGLQFTCTVGRFPNGRFGESFLNNIGSLMTDNAARRR